MKKKNFRKKLFVYFLSFFCVLSLVVIGQNMETSESRNADPEPMQSLEANISEKEYKKDNYNALSASTQTSDGLMEVHFIDVGQGDATLIKCGEYSMLVDAGDDSKGTMIQNYLTKQGVTRLDYLILTHPDADHIGGAPVIITKFDIDKVFLSNYEKDNKTYLKLIQALDNKNISYSTPAVGSVYDLGNASFTILGPCASYSNPNDSSIALLLQNGKNRFLFTGDAEENAEIDMTQTGIDISADVYQVGHHGSSSSSSKAFMEEVAPAYAVISCAEDNSYGHPHAETLNTLRSMGIQVFRTDEQGSVVAESDGVNIIWNCAPSQTWQAGEPKQNSTDNNQENEQSVQSKSAANAVKEVSPQESSPTVLVEEQPQIQQNTEAEEQQNENTEIKVHITKTGEKYHREGCQYLRKSDILISLEEAKGSGYEPCSKCNPPQ